MAVYKVSSNDRRTNIFCILFGLSVGVLMTLSFFGLIVARRLKYLTDSRLTPRMTPDTRLDCMLGKAPLATKLPIYYLNLDRSKGRRRYIEAELAPLGPLTRIAAADAKNKTVMDNFINTDGVGIEKYASAKSVEPGEIALTLSHIWAMKEAMSKNQTEVLVFEDDASLVLSPFWLKSIDQIVEETAALDPDWHTIQLNSLPKYAETLVTWRRSERFRLVWRYDINFPVYATGAMVLSDRGMKSVINRFIKDDKLNCPPRECVAEAALFAGKAYFVYPPLFQQSLNLGTTGVRKAGESILNDHFRLHYAFYMDALLHSADACESLGSGLVV